MSYSKLRAMLLAVCFVFGLIAARTSRSADATAPRPYRLPSVNIKQPVIWGSTCEGPDGIAISFGGEELASDDGLAHTRIRVDGKWIDLREMFSKDPRTKAHEKVWTLREDQNANLVRARGAYFDGFAYWTGMRGEIRNSIDNHEQMIANDITKLIAGSTVDADPTVAAIWKVVPSLGKSRSSLEKTGMRARSEGITARVLGEMRAIQVDFERIADMLGAEPAARALSPIVYEPKSKLFVLFGGDHCDYLTCDTWTFDPATRRWELRHPKSAPPPRANHTWKSIGDGKLVLTGGYTYFSNTDYMGGQYIEIGDGPWTYDVANDTWTGAGKTATPSDRTYRTGPFLPEYFYDPPPENPEKITKKLSELPANVWTKMNPPKLPKLNRDWGSAVIDPDRDQILRWSGGHCAHGGSDVIQYHLATNRWELCYPVEFPLGQLYDNTEYPGGFNFNRRPWISGHTYQNYGIDPGLKKMIFLGHSPWGYVYDPDRGDWTTRLALPKKMDYYGSMYTLTTTATPQGLICWTEPGEVFRFDAHTEQWKQLRLTGERLPGAVVDNSTVVYDSRRNRLLFARKPYGDSSQYDGEIHALDMDSLKVSRLSPAGKVAAAAIPYLCQLRYDAGHDLLLVGATLPAGPDGLRRTPAYDCQANKWMSLKITGDDPSGKAGRNVSLGLMYDAKRKLFWAVDTNSEVYVLRLEPASAEMHDL